MTVSLPLTSSADVNTGLGFVFIRGSLSSDVEGCTKLLQKWEKSVSLGQCIDSLCEQGLEDNERVCNYYDVVELMK